MARSKRLIQTPAAPAPKGPGSAQGVRIGDLLFVTGQSGRVPGSDTYLADPAAHARQTLENVKAIVEAGGSTMDRVIKRTVIVRDLEVFALMREIIDSYFPSPVASTTLRGALMLPEMLLEVEVIAIVPQ